MEAKICCVKAQSFADLFCYVLRRLLLILCIFKEKTMICCLSITCFVVLLAKKNSFLPHSSYFTLSVSVSHHRPFLFNLFNTFASTYSMRLSIHIPRSSLSENFFIIFPPTFWLSLLLFYLYFP